MGVEQLATWPTLVFGLFLYFSSKYLRKLILLRWPRLEKNTYWEDVFLPAIPSIIGVLLMFPLTKGKYPFPALAVTSVWAKVLYGAVNGAVCGQIYRIFKALVKRTWGVDLDSINPAQLTEHERVTIPPPPGIPQMHEEEHHEEHHEEKREEEITKP